MMDRNGDCVKLGFISSGSGFRVDKECSHPTRPTNPFSSMRDLNHKRETRARRAQTASMRHIVVGFCRTALDDYRQAGYPFGKSMDGLLIWFEYGQHTMKN